MGLFSSIWSMLRFKKKLTTQERLQNIDDKLDKLDGSLHLTRQHQQSAGFLLVTVSVLIYIPSMIIFYLWYFPVQWLHRVLYMIPFIIFPVLVYFLKKLLQYIFINRISNNANAVKELKKDKKKILENVMDTETYKVAKELLQKYDPNRSLVEESESPSKQTPKHVTEGQALRRRVVGGAAEAMPQVQVVKPLHASVNGYPNTSASNVRIPAAMHMPNNSSMRTPQPVVRGPGVRGPVPVAPILPRERSAFDKFADYFIGDGPSNRFALICKQCYGHNGMVLTEEFEFTSYRCCYCGVFNPSRKQRLNAPRLESRGPTLKRQLSESSNSTTDAETSNKADEVIEKEEGSGVEENTTVFEEDVSKHTEESVESSTHTTEGESSGVEEISKVDNTVEDVTNDSNETSQSKADESEPTDETKKDR